MTSRDDSIVFLLEDIFQSLDAARVPWAALRNRDRIPSGITTGSDVGCNGGPLGIARIVTQVLPQQDVVILLDAPADVLQRRKQEVPPAETHRQRDAYVDYVNGLSHGVIIDATQPLDDVVNEARHRIMSVLARRAARTLHAKSERVAHGKNRL
jgi:hypothetical protein